MSSAKDGNMTNKIDREFVIRVYIAGSDFKYADAEHDLPYCIETLPGESPKKRSFETMYTKYIIEQGKAEDDYVPTY